MDVLIYIYVYGPMAYITINNLFKYVSNLNQKTRQLNQCDEKSDCAKQNSLHKTTAVLSDGMPKKKNLQCLIQKKE